MDMKRYLYIGAFFIGISVLFGCCYYWSFQNALRHFNKEAVEHNTELLNELLQYSDKSEQLLQQLINGNTEEVVEAAVSGETLRANASYFLETFYLQQKIEKREQLALPGFMVGIDRKGLTAYMEGYMECMPINEYLDGLISYEIISFGSEQVVLRKTYDESKIEHRFYLRSRGDFVVVYYSDLKTVYEYTEISCDSLPEDVQESLRQGFYVKDMEELYSILEGYTS